MLVAFSIFKGGSGTGVSNFKLVIEDVFDKVVVNTTDYETSVESVLHVWLAKLMHVFLNLLMFNVEYKTYNFYSRVKINRLDMPIFLGWFGNNTITVKQLTRVKSPIFIRLSDEWIYNGFIHYGSNEQSIFAAIYRQKKLEFLRQDNVHLICPSYWIRERLLEQVKIPEEKVLFLPNGIDSFWREISDSDSRDGFLFISGNLDEKRKRVDLLLALISKFRSSYNVQVVGSGKRAVDLRAAGCTVHGVLGSHELRAVMRKTTYVLSLTDSDNSPNAVIEAILQGNVPIVRAGSGITSYIPPDLLEVLSFNDVTEIPEITTSISSKTEKIAQRCREYILELTDTCRLSRELKKFLDEKLK